LEIPFAFAGNSDTLCSLIPYPLDQASAQYAVNYTWTTSGTGSFSSQYQLNPVYFPSPADMNSGLVVLTLTITDQCNNVVSDDLTLTLSQKPVAFFTFTTPSCAGNSVSFTDLSAAVNGYIIRWIWDFGDGSPADTILFPENPNITKVYASPGIYPVTLSVLNSAVCCYLFKITVEF